MSMAKFAVVVDEVRLVVVPYESIVACGSCKKIKLVTVLSVQKEGKDPLFHGLVGEHVLVCERLESVRQWQLSLLLLSRSLFLLGSHTHVETSYCACSNAVECGIDVLLQGGTAFSIATGGRRLSRKDSTPFRYDGGVNGGNTATEPTDTAPKGTPTKTRRSREVLVGIGCEEGALWCL